MRNKSKLSKVLLKTKSTLKYLKYQKEIEKIEKELKEHYEKRRNKQENDAIKKIKKNPRAFYSYAKRFSKVHSGVGPFYDEDGELVNDDFKLAEILRKQYENVFSKPAPEMVATADLFNVTEEDFTDQSILTGIFFDRTDILEAIDNLSNYAAAGPDGFPAVLLKMCKYELVEPLEIIYKESLETGIIPNGWKKALIFPIHKGGSRSVPANYRPVSLTSHLMKTFERVIKRYLVANLEAHKKFNDAQHGFRHSTCAAL